MTVVRKEEQDRKFEVVEDKLNELASAYNDFQENVSDERRKRYDEISELKTEIKTFQKQIMTSISLLKWIISISALIITAVWPIIVFFVTRK